MNARARYLLLVVLIIILLHSILSFTNQEYAKATSLRDFGYFDPQESSAPPVTPDEYYDYPTTSHLPPVRKADATFIVLARNDDLEGVIKSMKQMEDRFNKRFNYPWTFLNEIPFSDEFKRRVTEITDSPVEFGVIPHEHWFQPDWIDEEKATKNREELIANDIIYGGSVPYRNMCRFNSGFFFRHELLEKYKYYWRVEPHVTYFCDLDYDPFLFMQDNNKIYGFTIALYEYTETIVTLWDVVKDFIKQNPGAVAKDNAMAFLSDDGGEDYNHCHYWSNFEIGNLDFYRNDTYMKYFEFLDQAGGFYYERWGDAPVHSIAASLFLNKDQLHFFDDIGYRHEPFQHCPQGDLHSKGKCWCEESQNFDYDWFSCKKRFDDLF